MSSSVFFFFFNDTATTEIYTLSLHDALPICRAGRGARGGGGPALLEDRDRRRRRAPAPGRERERPVDRDGDPRAVRLSPDRKSTRLNSSHANISYAVFCLKKKKKTRK